MSVCFSNRIHKLERNKKVAIACCEYKLLDQCENKEYLEKLLDISESNKEIYFLVAKIIAIQNNCYLAKNGVNFGVSLYRLKNRKGTDSLDNLIIQLFNSESFYELSCTIIDIAKLAKHRKKLLGTESLLEDLKSVDFNKPRKTKSIKQRWLSAYYTGV